MSYLIVFICFFITDSAYQGPIVILISLLVVFHLENKQGPVIRMNYSSIVCSQLKRVQMVLMCEGFIFIIFYIQLNITSSYYMVYKVTRFCMEGFQYGSVNLTIVLCLWSGL